MNPLMKAMNEVKQLESKLQNTKSRSVYYIEEVADVQSKLNKARTTLANPAGPTNMDDTNKTETDKLIGCIGKKGSLENLSSDSVFCSASDYIQSNHEVQLRNIALCHSNDKFFATSGLDGTVRFWEVKGRRVVDRGSTSFPKGQTLWSGDIAWHPTRELLFWVQTEPIGATSVISITNFEAKNVKYWTPKNVGIINGLVFMPWSDKLLTYDDKDITIWKDAKGGSWEGDVLKSRHSYPITSCAGLQEKEGTVLSVAGEEELIQTDFSTEVHIQHNINTKCFSVVPNPVGSSLLMIETETQEEQLQLYDIRVMKKKIHSFGWYEPEGPFQPYISQDWSPDGYYISSGSENSMIRVFDIRYNRRPCEVIGANQMKVFRAIWHPTKHLLISIDDDFQIGLHTLK